MRLQSSRILLENIRASSTELEIAMDQQAFVVVVVSEAKKGKCGSRVGSARLIGRLICLSLSPIRTPWIALISLLSLINTI